MNRLMNGAARAAVAMVCLAVATWLAPIARAAEPALVISWAGADAALSSPKDASLREALKRGLEGLPQTLRALRAENSEAAAVSSLAQLCWSPALILAGVAEGEGEGPGVPWFTMSIPEQSLQRAIERAASLSRFIESQSGETPRMENGVRVFDSPGGPLRIGAVGDDKSASWCVALNAELAGHSVPAAFAGEAGLVLGVHADVRRIQSVLAREALPGSDAARVLDAFGLLGAEAPEFHLVLTQSGDRAALRLTGSRCGKAMALLGMMAGASLTPADLTPIPSDSTWFEAGHWDANCVTRLVEVFMGAERAAQFWQEGEEEIGLNIPRDVLAPLGSLWTLSTADSSGGGGLASLVVSVSVKDRARLLQTHGQILDMARGPLEEAGEGLVRIASWNEGNADRFSIQSPGIPLPIEPSWAMTRDRLVIGATPQALDAALARLAKADANDSVLKKAPELAAALKESAGVGWIDSARLAPRGYGTLTLLGVMADNVARAGNGEWTRRALPPFGELMKDIGPMRTTTRYLGDGFELRSEFDRSFLVNSAALVGGSGGMSGTSSAPLFAGLLLPALSRAREQANQVKQASYLRQLGMAMVTYAMDNRDKLPTSRQQILDAAGEDSAFLFESLYGPAPDGGDSIYVRFEGRMNDFDSNTILVVDRACFFSEGATNVAFGDNHVEWLTADGLGRYLEMPQNKGVREALNLPGL